MFHSLDDRNYGRSERVVGSGGILILESETKIEMVQELFRFLVVKFTFPSS